MTKVFTQFPRSILILITICFILRIGYFFLFCDLKSENYWEFGEIAKNIVAGKGYSLFHFHNGFIEYHYMQNANPLPSAYMPPLYVFYLIPFIIINDVLIRNIFLFTSQAILSCLTIFFFYKAIEKNFNSRIAFISVFIYALLPEFIYASNTVGTTTLYHTLVAFIFYYLTEYDFLSYFSYSKSIFLGFIFASLIYLRPEVAVFFVFLAIYYLIKKKIKIVVIITLTTIILLLPWFIRNFIIFYECIPFTTSNGLNFFRGNNPYRLGFWSDSKIEEAKYKTVPDVMFESKLNEFIFNRTIELIKNEPDFLLPRALEKLLSFLFVYSYDERTSNLAYLLPWLSLLVLSIIGILKTFSFKKHYFLYLFLLYHFIIAIIFFTLPRYQTMYKIALLPFAGVVLELIFNSIKSKLTK